MVSTLTLRITTMADGPTPPCNSLPAVDVVHKQQPQLVHCHHVNVGGHVNTGHRGARVLSIVVPRVTPYLCRLANHRQHFPMDVCGLAGLVGSSSLFIGTGFTLLASLVSGPFLDDWGFGRIPQTPEPIPYLLASALGPLGDDVEFVPSVPGSKNLLSTCSEHAKNPLQCPGVTMGVTRQPLTLLYANGP